MKQSRGNARTFSTPATDHISRYAPFPPPPPASIHGCGSTQEIEKSDHSRMKNLMGFLRLGFVLGLSWQTRHVFLLRLAYIYIYISTVWGRTGRCCCIVQQQPEPATARRLIGSDMSAVCESALLTLLVTGKNLRRLLSRACLGNWTFLFFHLRRTWQAKKREEGRFRTCTRPGRSHRAEAQISTRKNGKTAPSDQISPFLVVPSLSWQLIVALRIVVPAK